MIELDWDVIRDQWLRLGTAALLGGLIGMERQIHGHWAGLRTHIGVAVGAAAYVLLATYLPGDANRVVQGVATGIGFLGAGTILKLSEQLEVKGLTTASSIWLTAAIGIAAGLQHYYLAINTTILTLLVLAVLRPIEKRFMSKS
ncbi:MAG: Mg(2+) transporter [Pirellulaceae bacterium]|nr:MAG: Mg(2+) transporter [Pirellulaceae bacterium]